MIATHRIKIITLLFMVAQFGCTAPRVKAQNASPYTPTSQPSTTLESAKSNLAALLKNRSHPFSIEFTPPRQFASKQERYELLQESIKNGCDDFVLQPDPKSELKVARLKVQTVPVHEDKMYIPFGAPLYFNELSLCPRTVTGSRIDFCSKVAFVFDDSDQADVRRIADTLLTIQEQLDRQTALFEQRASEYRSLTVKPAISEEQRRLIVQANLLTQQKNYRDAIARYEEVIKLDPTAYPAAYYNLALLWAQEEQFAQSIKFMKHYLLLVPDAKDARSAQDKIYEWEGLLASKRR